MSGNKYINVQIAMNMDPLHCHVMHVESQGLGARDACVLTIKFKLMLVLRLGCARSCVLFYFAREYCYHTHIYLSSTMLPYTHIYILLPYTRIILIRGTIMYIINAY